MDPSNEPPHVANWTAFRLTPPELCAEILSVFGPDSAPSRAHYYTAAHPRPEGVVVEGYPTTPPIAARHRYSGRPQRVPWAVYLDTTRARIYVSALRLGYRGAVDDTEGLVSWVATTTAPATAHPSEVEFLEEHATDADLLLALEWDRARLFPTVHTLLRVYGGPPPPLERPGVHRRLGPLTLAAWRAATVPFLSRPLGRAPVPASTLGGGPVTGHGGSLQGAHGNGPA